MKSIASYFFLLALALCLLITAAQAPEPSAGLLEKACERSNHKAYCINLLNSDPNSHKSKNLLDLAFIALKLAEKNATETSLFIKKTLETKNDDELEPAVQQALSDCSGHYINAVELIEDAIDALVSKASYDNVTKWVKAAVADLDGCAAGVNDQHQVVASMNRDVRQITNTALSVAHVASP